MKAARSRTAGGTRLARGFSLIEVMVAAAVFMAAVAGVFMGLRAAMSMHLHQNKLMPAVHIAESMLEEMLIMYADSPELTDGTHTACYRTDGSINDPCSVPPQYQARWLVADDNPRAGVKRIAVTVSWLENTRSRQISFFTYKVVQ